MQMSKIVHAVILMTIVALAASCATGKEYATRIFGSRDLRIKDTTVVAIRFLELDNDSLQDIKDGWVKNSFNTNIDSTKESNKVPVVVESKTPVLPNEPVAKTNKPGEVRTKRTRE